MPCGTRLDVNTSFINKHFAESVPLMLNCQCTWQDLNWAVWNLSISLRLCCSSEPLMKEIMLLTGQCITETVGSAGSNPHDARLHTSQTPSGMLRGEEVQKR